MDADNYTSGRQILRIRSRLCEHSQRHSRTRHIAASKALEVSLKRSGAPNSKVPCLTNTLRRHLSNFRRGQRGRLDFLARLLALRYARSPHLVPGVVHQFFVSQGGFPIEAQAARIARTATPPCPRMVRQTRLLAPYLCCLFTMAEASK